MSKSMFVLSVIGVVDSISFMAVSPSLIFYVLQLGGSKEQYGLIMSIFSFASFAGKPIYGAWVDKGGNKFRVPYLFSLLISVVGAILYLLAVLQAANPAMAVGMIFVGRLLSGLGAANQALGFAYIAYVVPQEMQTRTSTLLSMMRIVGMTIGPGINYFLDKVDSTIWGVPLDPLNTVGLLLAVMNLVTLFIVYFFLPEPPEKVAKKKLEEVQPSEPALDTSGGSMFWHACLSIDISLPCVILFASNSAFQLIETALPAAAADGLGWGPVETSGVLGATSIVIFGVMVLVMVLSSKLVSDTTLVVVGNVCFVVGGTCIYLFWTNVGNSLHYIIPVIISVAGFPFIASPNRSNFTKAVMTNPVLESSQATMQALLSMMASAAGFTTPGFVAAYVIRSPEEVEAAGDHRELTPLALYAPVLCISCLMGLYYKYRRDQRIATVLSETADIPGEGTPLMARRSNGRRSSVMELHQTFRRSNEVARRSSVEIMGFPNFDTHTEEVTRASQLKELEELVALGELDFEDDDMS
eukprot:scaffold2557_cov121-Cylindrotheca_fusiformis.AAC.22